MRVGEAREILGVSIKSDLVEVGGTFESLGSDVVDGLLHKEDPSPEIKTWTELTKAFETVLSNYVRRNTTRDEDVEKPSSKGVGGRWPAVLELDTVRSLLSDWATRERWVDAESFANDLELSNHSFAEYTLSRMIETRKELVRSVAGRYEPPAQNMFTGAIADALVPAQDNLKDVIYELHRPGTVSTSACGHCGGSGRSLCFSCHGSGEVKCNPTERCHVCYGTGKVSDDQDGSRRESRCPACFGTGNITCPKCQGSGSVTCSSCRGRGDIDCSDCSTTGLITTYEAGLVERKREDKLVGAWPQTVPSSKAARKSIPLDVNLPGNEVPEWIPLEDQGTLKGLLPKHPQEVYRELGIEIWPVTRVDYLHKGKSRALFIIGSDGQVVAPAEAKQGRRIVGLIVAGAIVIVGLIAGALFATGILGEDSENTSQVEPGGAPTLTGQEIEDLVRTNFEAVEGTGSMPETTTCPEGSFGDGETVTCYFDMEDGRVAELIITLERSAGDWRLDADLGGIDP